MDFRPEAQHSLLRWTEPAIATTLSAFVLYAGLEAALKGGLLGWPVALIGLALGAWAWTAILRAWTQATGGSGIVIINERRISVSGTYYGGSLSLEEITAIDIDIRRGAGAQWVIYSFDNPALRVSIGAEGAENLTDAFAALPGFSTTTATRAIVTPRRGTHHIWKRPSGTSPLAPLHADA